VSVHVKESLVLFVLVCVCVSVYVRVCTMCICCLCVYDCIFHVIMCFRCVSVEPHYNALAKAVGNLEERLQLLLKYLKDVQKGSVQFHTRVYVSV